MKLKAVSHLFNGDALGLRLQEDTVQDGQELPDPEENEHAIPADRKFVRASIILICKTAASPDPSENVIQPACVDY